MKTESITILQPLPKREASAEKELSELDDWILENLYGWKRGARFGNGNGEWFYNGKVQCTWQNQPKPTTDSVASMEVLKKCGDVCIQKNGNGTWVVATLPGDVSAYADTLELAIALFARKLPLSDPALGLT